MKEIQRWTEPTKCKMPSKKKLKLNSFRADDSLPQFCGRPDSRAAVAQMLMAAKGMPSQSCFTRNIVLTLY